MKLQEIGLKHGTDKAYAHQYCDFYEKNLPKDISRLLEIGVKDGASLKMWREYYSNPNTEIVGIDINPVIKIEGCEVHQLDQCDVVGLIGLGMFDIIVDDGSHMTLHQQISFLTLFETNLKKGGVYIMEDVHTSFYKEYINSRYTTYDFLQAKKHIFKQIEWCRVEDKTDSLTMIIYK